MTRVYNVSLSLFTWALNNLPVLFTWTFNKPFLFSVQCAYPVTKLYEVFRGNLHWLYSLTKYSLLQLSRPVLTLVSGFFSFAPCFLFCGQNLQAGFSTNYARFIRTVCMRRIRWSCEGLMSVHNEYTGYTLKHLLLRHMYNLPLPVLTCYALEPRAATLRIWLSHCTVRCFIYCLCRC